MKFSIKDFASKSDQIRRKHYWKNDLVTFTEEIFNDKTLYFVQWNSGFGHIYSRNS